MGVVGPSARISSMEMPASLGTPGPGEMTIQVRTQLTSLLDADGVVPPDRDLRPELGQILEQGCT